MLVSVEVAMLKVTAPAAPFTARLEVHVITARLFAVSVAPTVMVSAAPTVAADNTTFAAPPLVAVHVVAALDENKLADGVIVMVPVAARLVAGVNEIISAPPGWPLTYDCVRAALPHNT